MEFLRNFLHSGIGVILQLLSYISICAVVLNSFYKQLRYIIRRRFANDFGIDNPDYSKDVIMELLTELPAMVEYEGIMFNLILLHDVTEIRLCYDLAFIGEKSIHFNKHEDAKTWSNPFRHSGTLEGGTCDFLYLCENITNNLDLLGAIRECKYFLITNNLIPKK